MKKFRTMLAVIFTLVLAAGALAGCGNKTLESSSTKTLDQRDKTSEDVYEVHFYNWTSADNVKALEEAFNKEYAGKYKFVYEKLTDWTTLSINTALASGEKIDVMTQSIQFDLRQRADGGAYMGLKQFFDKEGWAYKDIFGEAFEETQNMNGDYYSIPYSNNIYMVFFNKKMFDEAGVEYPETGWTWQDFREIANRLTRGSGADKVYGAMIDVVGADLNWDLIARQKLGNFAYYNKDFTASTFDTPEMKESLQYFADLSLKDRCMVPLDESAALKYENDTNAMQGLYNGKFAMWISPSYSNLYLSEGYGGIPEGTDIGMVNIPAPDGGQTISTCYSSTASIPSSVEDPEAAWTLLKFITIDHADLFAGPKAMSPGYKFKTEEEAAAFNDLIFDHGNRPGFDYDMAMKTMLAPRTLVSRDNTIIQGQTAINETMISVMTMVFNGEMTVDEGLAELKTKADEAIKKDLADMK